MMILVINPGSTSTKIAVFDGDRELFTDNIAHAAAEIAKFPRIVDQKDFRKEIILKFLMEKKIAVQQLAAVVGRGGALNPMPGGVYRVGPQMLEDLYNAVQGEHASNLGGLIANEISAPLGIPAFIADPIVVDELADVARLTGIKDIKRRSIFHALNHKYCARLAAGQLGKKYEEVNLIVAHLGGGISVAAHERGRIVEVNNALNGEGPIAPERAGTMPAWDLVELALSGKYSKDELKKLITGKGGLVSLIGTNDLREVLERIAAGDEQARIVFAALAYRIAKEIGACACVLRGQIDGIVLTGGLAHCPELVAAIRDRAGFLAEFILFPGENEMLALVSAALRVLRDGEVPLDYPPAL